MTYDELPGLRSTAIKSASDSLLSYKWHQDHPKEDTPALKFGRAIHVDSLEPEKFSEIYRVYEGQRRGKAWAEFAEAAVSDGVEVLTSAERAKVAAVSLAIRSHPAAGELLGGGLAEQSIQWDGPHGRCKALIDYLRPDCAIDLKTAADPMPGMFARSFVKYKYAIQLGHYNAAIQSVRSRVGPWCVIAACTAPPYEVVVYEVPSWVVEAGQCRAEELAAMIAEADKSGIYPPAYPGVIDLDYPEWATEELIGDLGMEF